MPLEGQEPGLWHMRKRCWGRGVEGKELGILASEEEMLDRST